MKQARSYDKEFKEQAVKLAKEVGTKKAAEEWEYRQGRSADGTVLRKEVILRSAKESGHPKTCLRLPKKFSSYVPKPKRRQKK